MINKAIAIGLLGILVAAPAYGQRITPPIKLYPYQLNTNCNSASIFSNLEVDANRESDAQHMKASSVMVEKKTCQRLSEIIMQAIIRKEMIILYGFKVSEDFFKFNGIYDKEKSEDMLF
ncbi:hypothetical protein HYV81_04600 [Candidatus Woesearchaeota archaeon]|nr:hypothetical protein [Candidatus Woesearchaeota archaeon]